MPDYVGCPYVIYWFIDFFYVSFVNKIIDLWPNYFNSRLIIDGEEPVVRKQ
jgi:hypothetical protein